MAGTSAGIVAGLAAAAIGAVGILAYQASANVPPALNGKSRSSTAPAVAPTKAPRDRQRPTALPPGSGTGERVVYSVDDDRVWLVGGNNKVGRTFKVAPGNVDPPPGSYFVTSRSSAVTGTDGLPVEHVVRFTSVDDVVVGFSAVREDKGKDKRSEPALGLAVKTGAIRESRADGDAMWEFATIGVRIVVIR
ncbi:hypothetical protein [Streptomyces sp. NPDC002758]